ncbi:hypothetical protein [Nocardia sp. NPDC127526]|uniref:hypothetical protein n=1 Tax=Nocardia sp. NPDC127526 TaxID=3345393 RepID=UPI0036396AAD
MAQLLVDVDMLTEEQAGERLRALTWLDDDEPEEMTPEDLVEALEELGVAVITNYDAGDSLDEGYAGFFEKIARWFPGTVEISDVRVIDDELHWVWNGQPNSWHTEHMSDRVLNTLTMFEIITSLPVDGDREIHQVGWPDHDPATDDAVYVLATPAQALALGEALGLTLESLWVE